MVNFLGIEFAPLSVPAERRLQTLCVFVHVCNFTINPVLCIVALVYLLWTSLWFVSVGYIAWIVYDVHVNKTSERGGRTVTTVRELPHQKYLTDYFPVKLIKTAELDPTKNYIFGYHPHGIIAFGCLCNFGTEGTGFSKLFPGIHPHMLTLDQNFKLPLIREYSLWLGICSVTKNSIQWLLNDRNGGNAAIIVVGGAAEALDANPGNYQLTLARRRGFVRMALESGASLVPIFSFGENDLYKQADNPDGSTLRQIQVFLKNQLGVSPPLFYGRGVFNYNFGLLPQRTPIHTVVGAPIDLPKEEKPSNELIAKYHKIYTEALAKLFDDHKVKYGIDPEKHLKFV